MANRGQPRSSGSTTDGRGAETELQILMRKAALRYWRELVAERHEELLESLYSRWVKVKQMRRFVALLEARLVEHAPDPRMAIWTEWARGYITEQDPLSEPALSDLLSDADVLAPDPIDDEPWDREEQMWRDFGDLDDLVDELEANHRASPTQRD